MGMLQKRKGRPKKHFEHIEKEEIWCSRCKKVSVISNSNVKELVCGLCFAREMIGEEVAVVKEKQSKLKYPRGWHRKKLFVSDDGKTFSFGKEITNVKKRRKS